MPRIINFEYVVGSGESSPDLSYLGAGALTLNGGTITNGGDAANLTLPVPGEADSLSSNNDIEIIDVSDWVVSDSEHIWAGWAPPDEEGVIDNDASELKWDKRTETLYAGNGLTIDVTGGLNIESSIETKIGDIDADDCISIDSSGDLTFNGGAGFYPVILTQDDEPTSGTGATQIDTSEMKFWIDDDDSDRIYLCINQGGTIKKVELT